MSYHGRHHAPGPSRRRRWVGGAGVGAVLTVAAGFVVLQPFPPGPAVAESRSARSTAVDAAASAAGAAPSESARRPTSPTAGAEAPSGTSAPSGTAAGRPGAGTPSSGASSTPSSGQPRTDDATGDTAAAQPSRLRPLSVARATRPCRPTRLTVEGLDIDARVVPVGLARDGSLGVPSESDRAAAGWYPSVLAGAAQGTVLMDGHTYRDGSAIFTTDSPRRAHLGMMVQVACTDDTVVSYRLSELHLDLSPDDYPDFVSRRDLYAADGPAQLVIVTCTGWNTFTREWDHRAVLIATPWT